MVFTLIFQHYDIPIPANESTIKLRHTDFYSDSTLHRMGFTKKDGAWVKINKSSSLPPQAPTTDLPASPTQLPEPHIPSSPPHPSAAPTSPAPPAPPPVIQTPLSLSSDQLALISSTILNAITPKLDELQQQNIELRHQNLELKTEYLSHISELKAQNLQLQAQLATSPVPPSTSSSLAPLPKEIVQAIAKAIYAEFRGKFSELQSQLAKVTEEVSELESTMSQLQRKINKAAETLLQHVWDISLKVQDEHKDYGIEGIAKELGMLKSKIDDGVQAIALLTNDLKVGSSNELASLMATLRLLTKEISKRFMIKI